MNENTDSNRRTVEINGVKLDIDLRTAVRIETMRIGTKVKVLCKGSGYGDTLKVFPGVIVGFEPFASMPTIVVVFVDGSLFGEGVKLAYINESKDSTAKWEIVPAIDDDLPVAKNTALRQMERALEESRAKTRDLEARRDYFLANFGVWFAADEPAAAG